MFATIGYYICIPFAWLLRALYELTSSYGWALVLFTVVIKLIMLPFQMKSKKSMMRMSRFQPMIKEIQTRYKNNQVKMNEELQRLYAGRRQPHERLPVELPALPHPHCPIFHHPSAHHALHDAHNHGHAGRDRRGERGGL